MRKLPLPDALKDYIGGLTGEIALTDADGRVVAYLFAPNQREAFYDMAFELADATIEDVRKHRLSPERTAEVLSEMRALMAKTAKAS
jgi:hypothetical protein